MKTHRQYHCCAFMYVLIGINKTSDFLSKSNEDFLIFIPRFLPALRLLQDNADGRLNINLGDALRYNISQILPKELSKPWHDPELPDIR